VPLSSLFTNNNLNSAEIFGCKQANDPDIYTGVQHETIQSEDNELEGILNVFDFILKTYEKKARQPRANQFVQAGKWWYLPELIGGCCRRRGEKGAIRSIDAIVV